jgi:hypothetical protein
MLLGGAAVRDDQLRDGQAEDADNSHIEVVPISTGVSIPVQQAPHGWQPPHPYNPKVESVEQQPLHKTEAEEKKSKEQLCDKDPPTSPISTDTCDGDVGSGARCAVALPADPKSQHKGKSGAAAQPLALEQEPSTAADTPISVPEEPAHDQQLQPSCNVRRSCQNSTSVSTPAQACSKENARGSANLQQVVSPVTAHRKAEAGDRSRRPRQGFLSLTAGQRFCSSINICQAVPAVVLSLYVLLLMLYVILANSKKFGCHLHPSISDRAKGESLCSAPNRMGFIYAVWFVCS